MVRAHSLSVTRFKPKAFWLQAQHFNLRALLLCANWYKWELSPHLHSENSSLEKVEEPWPLCFVWLNSIALFGWCLFQEAQELYLCNTGWIQELNAADWNQILCTLTLFAVTKVHVFLLFGHTRAVFVFLQGRTTQTDNEWQRKRGEKRRVEKCFVFESVMFNICQLFCQVWPVLVWMFDTTFVLRRMALYSRPLKMLLLPFS